MLNLNYYYKSVFKGNIYPTSISNIRNFSKSQAMFFPRGPRLPATPVAPFTELTDDIRSFIGEILLRNLTEIERLNHTIQDNNNNIRDIYNAGNLYINIDGNIEWLRNLIEQDINLRQVHQDSADLLGAIYAGEDPPINNMNAWLNFRNDLDNTENPALHSLREYVREVIDRHINDQFLEMAMDLIRIGRENLPDNASRDNSQYSDELVSSSESNSDVYLSAYTHHDESSYNDSDSNDNLLVTDQGLNLNDNLSDENNELNSDIDLFYDSHEFNQYDSDHQSNTNINQSSDQDKSNSGSDGKYITDDALDISDTLHMFYDESLIENQSTVDFVLQRQQEEMPAIMDSDGGE